MTIILYLGKTSLMYAAESGNNNTVKILIENKADVNAKDKDGQLYNIITLYLFIVSLPYSIYHYAYIKL